jgi:hypothetical protein
MWDTAMSPFSDSKRDADLVHLHPHPYLQKVSLKVLSIPQIELNVTQAYIRHIQETFDRDDYYAGRYLFILQIREWQLKRKLLNKPVTLENLQTLKTGHRNAEKFYLDLDLDEDSTDPAVRKISQILQLIAIEFHAEIVEIEVQHPDMRAEFAREREEYRLMWNDYVKDAQEAHDA